MSKGSRKSGARSAKKARTPPAEDTAQETIGPAEPKAVEPKEKEQGRKRQTALGAALLFVGSFTTFLLMSRQGHVAHGPLWVLGAVLVAVAGLLELIGPLWRGVGAIPFRSTTLWSKPGEPIVMSPLIGAAVAVVVLIVGAAAFGYGGLPWTIVVALLCLLPAAIRRPGLLVGVIVCLLYLPLLGVYGLWDPWETHYGEVAREVLARDDWISLWWAQENWFWSKPILIFWTEGFTMGAFGVDPTPDANPLHPEWAIRLPVFLFSLAAVETVYFTVRRFFGTRAGVLGALVLSTTPYFFFLAHQAITDMLLVANMTIAMCLLAHAAADDPNAEVKSYRLGPIVLSGQHLVIGLLAVTVIPQVLYLMSRNVTMVEPFQFAWHSDEFMFGSAGNSGIPGNAAIHDERPWADLTLVLGGTPEEPTGIDFLQPMAQGLYWLLGLGGLLAMLWRERRRQALTMFGFYFFCALGLMGKGLPGFGLPGLVALFWLIASGRWSLLLEGRLRVAAGALTIAVTGLPWYVAMYIRHGPGFTDRILVHDHVNRAFSGVHGDTGSIQYFIWQLGYGTFPWVALLPAAVLVWLWHQRTRRDPTDLVARDQRDTLTMFGVWFFAAFALFSAMATKFHHYIFPAVPPAMILCGILLDRLFGEPAEGQERWREALGTLLACAAPLLIVLGLSGLWGDVRGMVPPEVEGAAREGWVADHPWSTVLCICLIALGALLGAGGSLLIRTRESSESSLTRQTIGALIAAGVFLLAFVGRDLAWSTSARPHGYERLIHLFIYNYGREWPQYLDYRPILTGFAIVSTGVLALCIFPRIRPVAARALLGTAIWMSAWTLDIYMIDLSPHWGQRELLAAYYEHRESPDEPVVAWQMNWKGENFYTGNRVSVFVDLDNREIRSWLDRNRGKTAFFMFEHNRLGSFRGLVRGHEVEEITDTRVCNKFILVRVRL